MFKNLKTFNSCNHYLQICLMIKVIKYKTNRGNRYSLMSPLRLSLLVLIIIKTCWFRIKTREKFKMLGISRCKKSCGARIFNKTIIDNNNKMRIYKIKRIQNNFTVNNIIIITETLMNSMIPIRSILS